VSVSERGGKWGSDSDPNGPQKDWADVIDQLE
jgi:hypothetical protein